MIPRDQSLFVVFLWMLLTESLGFTLLPPQRRNAPTTRARSTALFSSSSNRTPRCNVEIPLLELSESDYLENFIQPLPSAQLPDGLTTIYIYGMELTRPVHQMIVDDALEPRGQVGERIFGHVAYKPDPDSLVGAIGCTAQILLNAEQEDDEVATALTEQGQNAPKTVLCRGSYRFVVKEVVKTIPFPIAIVDELLDEEPDASVSSSQGEILDDDEEEEEDDDDDYNDLTPSELVQRTMTALKAYVDQQTEALEQDLSPLEQEIIENAELALSLHAQQQATEEMAAVFDVFQSSLPDICPTPAQLYFAVAFMAAEMTNFSNESRRDILRMTDGVQRLRYVLREVEETVGMERARKMANSITKEKDKDERDLKVGEPELPPWAKSIHKGMRVEYFWNEEWGWCQGEVVEDPMLVVDEIILTVRFDEEGDDSVHRLPFRADEKVRWRPPQTDAGGSFQ